MSHSTKTFNQQLLSIAPDVIIDLYEIDFSNLQANFDAVKDLEGINFGAEPAYRFCPMIHGTNPIIWQGKSYQPLPIKMENFEHQADGRLPRPKLTIANPEGLLSIVTHSNHDFANCMVRRTFARFLDDENFQNRGLNREGKNPFGAADRASHFPDDVYFVNRKTAENKESLEFELVSALELEDAQVPARIVLSGYCPFKYRCSVGCGYSGYPIENSDGKNFKDHFLADVLLLEDMSPLESHLLATAAQDALGLAKKSVDPRFPEWSPFGPKGSEGNIRPYEVGKMVQVNPTHETDPAPLVFMCIKWHSTPGKHNPLHDREHWGLDECNKDVSACKKRFGKVNSWNQSDEKGLRFGGFPSTERYSFE
jgi:lambda family phage minor tail protein L